MLIGIVFNVPAQRISDVYQSALLAPYWVLYLGKILTFLNQHITQIMRKSLVRFCPSGDQYGLAVRIAGNCDAMHALSRYK